MKALIQYYIRSGSLYGEEYVELNKELDLPFTPFVGLKLQLAPGDFSTHPEFVARLQDYHVLASGIIPVEEVYYHIEDAHFILTAWELADARDEVIALADQWRHIYGFTLIGHFGAPPDALSPLYQ
jgi:hypothetical protein